MNDLKYKHIMLNDFEKKTLLSELSDIGVFNMIARVDDYSRGFYTFFIDIDGLVVSKTILYCTDLNRVAKPCLSDFRDNVKKTIGFILKDYRVKFQRANVICYEDIEKASEDIYLFVKYSHNSYVYSGALSISLTNNDFKDLNEFTLSRLSEKTNVIEVLREAFVSFGMTRDIIESKIVQTNQNSDY